MVMTLEGMKCVLLRLICLMLCHLTPAAVKVQGICASLAHPGPCGVGVSLFLPDSDDSHV